jgi:predicted O-linked N-acetylglucosamine transferase (SPINDLY family)
MPSQQISDYMTLRRLLQQADAEWERLTRSIQADQQACEALQRHCENLHLLLALELETPAKPCPALAAQCALVECQLAQLEQKLLLERARRDLLEQQFDQVRLVLVTLRRMSQRQRDRRASSMRLLLRSMKWLLREFWAGLQTFEYGSQVIPNDRPLGQQYLSPPTP